MFFIELIRAKFKKKRVFVYFHESRLSSVARRIFSSPIENGNNNSTVGTKLITRPFIHALVDSPGASNGQEIQSTP